MGIWIMMALSDLLIPVAMLVFGGIFRVAPPKDINVWYGYRTRRSMATPEAWDFAHRYAGKIWLHLGIWTLALTAAALALLFGRDEDTVSWAGLGVMMAQIVPMIMVIPLTERALKKNFGCGGPIQ